MIVIRERRIATNDTAAKAHVKLAQSASHLEQSAEVQTDSADRRTELAAERTYAAWVRTGLAALAAGIGARALLDKLVPDWLIGATGSVLILKGLVLDGVSVEARDGKSMEFVNVKP
jgi:putative membrane protein